MSICLFFESRFLFIYLYLFIYYELACKQMSQIRNTQSACLFISTSSKTIDLVVIVICLSVMTGLKKKNHFKSYLFASCLNNIRCEYHTEDRNCYLWDAVRYAAEMQHINIVTIVIIPTTIFILFSCTKITNHNVKSKTESCYP